MFFLCFRPTSRFMKKEQQNNKKDLIMSAALKVMTKKGYYSKIRKLIRELFVGLKGQHTTLFRAVDGKYSNIFVYSHLVSVAILAQAISDQNKDFF